MGLCQGEGLFILCLFWGDSEKFRAKNKKLFFVFLDLEKALNWVPRKVINFALRRKGVPEYLENGDMSLYKGCKTTVSVDVGLSSLFSVKVNP